MANNLIRNTVKMSAKRLNEGTVKFASLIEENFEGVNVYVDQVLEGEESNDTLISMDEQGNIILGSSDDFMVIESGDFFPQNTNDKCHAQEQTTVTFVSNNRPDIIEDNLTLIKIGLTCNMRLDSISKVIQQLGNTAQQITIVTATFSRLAQV
mgnify:CR=1 FL=1|jgi:hypothetical protein|nr:MAG TPA: hypothetical protein [Caudoviricetes sp.]